MPAGPAPSTIRSNACWTAACATSGSSELNHHAVAHRRDAGLCCDAPDANEALLAHAHVAERAPWRAGTGTLAKPPDTRGEEGGRDALSGVRRDRSSVDLQRYRARTFERAANPDLVHCDIYYISGLSDSDFATLPELRVETDGWIV